MFEFNKIIKNICIKFPCIKHFFSNEEEKEHELQMKIIQAMIGSYDPEELKNKIVKEVATALNAYRCFFIEYDSSTHNFKKITNAYNSQRDVLSILNLDIEKDLPSIAMKQKYLKSLLVRNTEEFISQNKLEGSKEEFYFKKYNIGASVSARLEFGENFLGILVVQYDHGMKSKLNNDLKFLKNVAEHVSIALHLSTLYSEEKAEKEKEKLLRSIISIMNTNYHITQIAQKISELLTKIYDASNIIIDIDIKGLESIYYDNSHQSNKPQSIIDTKIYELTDFDSTKSKTNYISDTHNFVIQNNLESSQIDEHFKSNNIKSLILQPILYENAPFGLLIIHFDKPNQVNSDDLDFIKTVTNQLAIAIKQTIQYKKQKRTAERERILRDITEKIRSSMSIEETLTYICKETAKLFNVQRATITIIPDTEHPENFILRKEYITDVKLKGITQAEEYKKIGACLWASLAVNNDTIAFDDITQADIPDFAKKGYEEIGIKSIIGTSIKKGNDIYGVLVLSEYNTSRHWSEKEKTLLASIANQIYIAINQAELYNSLKQTTANQKAILNNIPYWAWLKDKENRFILVNKMLAKDMHLPAESFVGKTDYDLFPQDLADNYRKDDIAAMDSRELKIVEEETIINGQRRFIETYKQPLFDNQGEVTGTAGIAKDITEKKENDIELAKRQEKIIKAKERESLLRKILEAMRVSLDINTIKHTIVNEVGKALDADICFLLLNKPGSDIFSTDEHSEYQSPGEKTSFINFDSSDYRTKWFIDTFKEHKEFSFYNADAFINENNLQGSPEEEFLKSANIKSTYNVSISYANTFLGYVVIMYTKDYKQLEEENITFLKIIADQAGIALHQAELYQLTQLQAETEKFNRKILEILRNALDKNTIKHLFVQNIGQYFQASRVFFSDYDPINKMYLPVENGSEYLSSPAEKSFVGYDLANESATDYIQPLLNKRELKILCWEDYIRENSPSQEFIAHFEDFHINSSYNLPVVYEGKIMGYFCIEFTQKGCNKLSDENINIIRSMCTQAGIALYHAELFTKAQEMARTKTKFIETIASESKKMLNNIAELADKMEKTEPKCDRHIEHLDHINESIKQFLNFTNRIIDNEKSE